LTVLEYTGVEMLICKTRPFSLLELVLWHPGQSVISGLGNVMVYSRHDDASRAIRRVYHIYSDKRRKKSVRQWLIRIVSPELRAPRSSRFATISSTLSRYAPFSLPCESVKMNEKIPGSGEDMEMDLQRTTSEMASTCSSLWPPNAPLIVRDYTDHGPKHSERVMSLIGKLLEANNGSPLSNEEGFLLKAATLLHDIGMQCDIARLPKVREKAEVFGAQFNLTFYSESATAYSYEEQDAIRSNHNFISAAWLDVCFATRDAPFGTLMLKAAAYLKEELIKICLYHRNLRITECSSAHRMNIRTQLLTALLRLADELDIDPERGDASIPEHFKLLGESPIFWALHGATRVRFLGRQVILLRVELHPDDKELSPVVQSKYIDKILVKCRPVIGVLRSSNIPIAFSEECRVEITEYATKLPQEVVDLLTSHVEEPASSSLAKDAIQWLEALGFEATDPVPSSQTTSDVRLSLKRGPVAQEIHLRCYEGEINKSDLELAAEDLDGEKWCLAEARVDPEAYRFCSSRRDLRVYTLSEMLKMIWRPYVESLRSEIEKKKIEERYVDLACYKEVLEEADSSRRQVRYESVTKFVDAWMQERGRQQLCLLGEFGTGKTWFCKHYAYRQLERFFRDPQHERFPVLISLRHFAKAMTAEQIVTYVLVENYRLSLVGSAYDVLSEINRQGKLLLLLDGFDEMAKRVDMDTMVKNFQELSRFFSLNGKMLLTARTEYFRSLEEAESLLNGSLDTKKLLLDSRKTHKDLAEPHVGERGDAASTVISWHKHRFETIHLMPLTDDQIKKIISNIQGREEGGKSAELVLGDTNLAGLARKPVLIELLLAALVETGPANLKTSADVYLFSTRSLLLRNIRTDRTFTTTEDKLLFLCELGWEMISTGKHVLNYREFPSRIKASFGEKVKDYELDYWDVDLRSQTLLHRDVSGNYQFAHRSLGEFFSALKLGAEAGVLSERFSSEYPESDGSFSQLPIKKVERRDLVKSFGLIPFSSNTMLPTRLFLAEMLGGEVDVRNRLLGHIQAFHAESTAAAFTGGNAFTLLVESGLLPQKQDFTNRSLDGAALAKHSLLEFECNLSGCSLKQADLRGSQFSEELLRDALFNYTLIRVFFRTSLGQILSFYAGLKTLPTDDIVRTFVKILKDKMSTHFERFGVEIHRSETLYPADISENFGGFLDLSMSGNVSEWAELKREFVSGSGLLTLAFFSKELQMLREALPEMQTL
jgi:hypothetical protein